MISRPPFLTLTTSLFVERTRRKMAYTWNTFLKILNARTFATTLTSVFSPPDAYLSLDMSSRMEYHLPAPDRLRPLHELPVPHDSTSVNRSLGLFSYYSQWIPKFSDRIRPIAGCKSFPLTQQAIGAFESLKKMSKSLQSTRVFHLKLKQVHQKQR